MGQLTDQIEVRADAALVKTRSAGVGTVVDNQRVLELPLNGRKVTELTAPGTYGNVGANNIAGPGMFQLDLAVTRTFSVGEGKTLQFRGEAFNLPNHMNPSNPVSTLRWCGWGRWVTAAPMPIPGYAFFAYPGKTFTAENRTPEVVRGLASLLRVDFRVLCIFILDSSGHRPPLQ